jgi:lipopolysaccharide/colanic/teichoic acid biosynthesis glycosyltransferase
MSPADLDNGAAGPVRLGKAARPWVSAAPRRAVAVVRAAERSGSTRLKQEIRFNAYPDESSRQLPSPAAFAVALPLWRIGLPAAPTWKRSVKRTIDIVGSTLGLLVLLPLFVVIGTAVKLTSPGPVFFVQRRVGMGGRPFSMIKFRSMHKGAHERRDEHVDLNIHGGPIFKVKKDPRITSVGRLIRRLSLDELPQLVNVLMGQMSLVGPRPCLPEEFVDFGERERERLLVKPGITCIWQVSGRSDLDFDTWVDMDLRYIASWTLLLDIKLLVLTLPAVVGGRGAY